MRRIRNLVPLLYTLLVLSGAAAPRAFAYEDLCADANDDSVVDVRDALHILQHSVEIPSPCATNVAACDVDGTGIIDVNDALDTLRQVVGYVFEWSCPFPVVVEATGLTPISGIDFLLTYPPGKSSIMSACDFGTPHFPFSASHQVSPTETRVAMITTPPVVPPKNIARCNGYGHYKTLRVSGLQAFDANFISVEASVVVIPNMPTLP